jgi:hypothetical protein
MKVSTEALNLSYNRKNNHVRYGGNETAATIKPGPAPSVAAAIRDWQPATVELYNSKIWVVTAKPSLLKQEILAVSI